MRYIKTYQEHLNESFLSNIFDTIKGNNIKNISSDIIEKFKKNNITLKKISDTEIHFIHNDKLVGMVKMRLHKSNNNNLPYYWKLYCFHYPSEIPRKNSDLDDDVKIDNIEDDYFKKQKEQPYAKSTLDSRNDFETLFNKFIQWWSYNNISGIAKNNKQIVKF